MYEFDRCMLREIDRREILESGPGPAKRGTASPHHGDATSILRF
jgi:hypothetical protein